MRPENPIPPAERTELARAERSIGAILLDAGRLSLEDAERVLRLQREEKIRFGQAGLNLGVLSEADIEYALARQFNYPYLLPGTSAVHEAVAAAYQPFSTQVEALRAVRSQLILRWLDGDHSRKALALISAEPKDGRSFIAANLAVVFSQLGKRTLLIDGDMRNPRQHELFSVDNRSGLSAALSGRAGATAIQSVSGLPELSILPAGATPPNPVDLLSRPLFAQLMQELEGKFDVILIDSPPATRYADAQLIAARAGAAVVIVRKNATRLWNARGISDTVSHTNAIVVGSVLNDY